MNGYLRWPNGRVDQLLIPGLTCDNETSRRGAVNTATALTHLLDLGERGLAVKATQTCSIEDCTKPQNCRGWCEMHYSRWRKNGSPHIAQTATPKRRPPLDRWWQRVDKSEDGCWEWTGGRFANGYGRFREPVTRRQQLAHRWGYLQLVGPIPEELELDHLCRNKGCVNPAHLEPVSHAENVRRWQVTVTKPTHCRNGHEYTPENSIYFGDPPSRRCVACRQIVARRRWGKS